MHVTFRPISTWPGGRLVPAGRRSPFRAGWSDTLEVLGRELHHLGADRVVVELGMTEADIRLDGWPRANARAAHPGVVVSFESRHGPLRYATCESDRWQDNLRAVALSLEALRKVDRYGVSKHGEQYRGWRALPAAGGESLVEIGREIIDRHGGVREALRATHPDHGGDADEFRAVQAAREAAA